MSSFKLTFTSFDCGVISYDFGKALTDHDSVKFVRRVLWLVSLHSLTLKRFSRLKLGPLRTELI